MAKIANLPAFNLALSNVIFGTIGLFAVQGALPPFVTVFWRCVFATLFLLAWCATFGYLKPAKLSAKLLLLAAVGGIGNIGSSVALFSAYGYTTIGTATIIYHIQPFFVVLIGTALFRETIKPTEICWIGLAFAGLVLSTGFVGTSVPEENSWYLGVGLSLIAAFLYSVGTVIGKGLGEQRPEVTTLMQTLVGALILSPFAELLQPVPSASWKWLVCLGVLHTGIAYVLMFSAYPHLRTPVIGVLAFLFPLVSILVDWLAYGKALQPAQWAGLALIMLGTLGVQLGWRPRLRRHPIAAQPPALE
ncbi:EamA family transporter [Mesorhizobium plurifarium]|uniref:DMT family transporter n=1 Tax=Sinorhizobium arboris TaxID=76745 RepID=UPI00067F00EA|nr:EamA family transporter [Sinorhizobium arboris]PST18679.1 EamA family transporter [Mesorhizobium plurifarium]